MTATPSKLHTPLRMRVSPVEWEARVELAACYRAAEIGRAHV